MFFCKNMEMKINILERKIEDLIRGEANYSHVKNLD